MINVTKKQKMMHNKQQESM